jgi:CheY-like chemotaxis protein
MARPISVLLVDDDRDIRDVVAQILEEEGYSVAVAGDGEAALQLLAEVRPRLILLDLNMPVMNGVQFRKRQSQDPALAAIPTVVMSAMDRLPDLVTDPPPDEALAKPISIEKLLAVVGRYAGAA